MSNNMKAGTKTTFDVAGVIQPIYNGGSVSVSEDGQILATVLGEEVILSSLTSGKVLARIEGDGEQVTTLAYTGSHIAICSRSMSMRLYALQLSDDLDETIEPKLLRTVKPHAAPVVTSAVDSTGSLLATGGADGIVKVWDIRGGFVTHTFHGHSGVISALHFFQVEASEEQPSKNKKRKSKQQDEAQEEAADEANIGYRLASGGEDGKVRVWDLHKRKAVATLDSHVSVVRSLDYSPEQKLLLSGSRDKTVIAWDAPTWKAKATVPVLEVVESVGFVQGGAYFYTGGETARLRIWSVEAGGEITEEQEPGTEIEAIVQVLHHPGLPFVLTVHADQTLILRSLEPLESRPNRKISALPVIRRISGTHDEVIDLAYVGAERNLLALATNLEDIRLVSLETGSSSSGGSTPYFGADVALLKGHDDIIITLDTDWSGHWLATGAKDNTAKLWRLDPANDSYECYATFTGHAESVGAVALPNGAPPLGSKAYNNALEHPPKFLITGSQDKTIKRWDIGTQGKAARANYTRKAHDKDINAIEVSHNTTTPLFASASQDRTVKIWDVEAGETIGVLRGHKRGVWSVAFAPTDMPALTITSEGGGASSAKGMVVTGSGDKTVRVWSLTDYSCLRTFEGHVNSVLKVVWLPPPPKQAKIDARRGIQVASAAGDGLVKVWDAQSGECAATLDNHIDRVWALAVKPKPILSEAEQKRLASKDTDMADVDEEDADDDQVTLISGSADSTLTFWNDTTAFTAQQATTQATERIEQDQELQNHIRANNYREAIVLALQLNHPKRLLDLFASVVNGVHDPSSVSGNIEVDEVLAGLSDAHLWALLRRLRDWNANARTHNVAQHILYTLLRLHPKERLLNVRRPRKNAAPKIEDVNGDLAGALGNLSTEEKNKESVKDVLDGLKAYTERHYARLDKMGEERFVLLWALQQMDGVAAGGALDGAPKGDIMMLE
jgi:U3 small nucleolar RNA-associated protein 13